MNLIDRYHSLPEPEREVLAASYREQVLRALGIAQTYDGSERKYQELIETLATLEEWVKSMLGIATDGRISRRGERKLSSELFGGTQHIVIDDVIALSAKRFSLILQGASTESLESFLQSLNVVTVSLSGVILPPGEQRVHQGNGECPSEKMEIQFQQRLAQFIDILQRQGIFTDDILVCHGEVSSNMMRQISYCIVEIPRLHKQVLLCDQVGEATFVVHGRLSRDTLMRMTKEMLQEKYSEMITRIVYTSSAAWEEQLMAQLFSGEVGAKVDLRYQEALRREILKLVPTAEEWAGINFKQKGKFKASGIGLIAIARRFGVEGNPIGNRAIYLELGREIYGECEELEYEEFPELTNDELKAKIIEVVPTPEEWAGMTHEKRRGFEVGRIKLTAIATRFGVGSGSLRNHKFHLELGRKIYGECEELRYEEFPELTNDELKAKIIEVVPTPEEWAGMTHKKKKKYNVCEIGLITIARRFGVEGNPVTNHTFHLELGREIYHECDVLKKKQVSLEDLKNAIFEIIPTAEEWAGMTYKEKINFEVGRVKITAIGTRFGMKDDSLRNHKFHLELGRKIYGECEELRYEEFPELTNDELKAKIIEVVPTPEEWAGMKVREKRKFEILGMKLTAISSRFGVRGDPVNYHMIHLKFGRAIYGDHPCLNRE